MAAAKVINAVARFGSAAILVIAATLKAFQLARDPALGVLYGSRLLAIGLVECEVALAAWLLCGFLPAWCRPVALTTFVAFASYSLYLAVTGAASCGCFGQVRINPWWTFSLDVVVGILLWSWEPVAQARPRRSAIALAAIALFAIVPTISVVAVHRTEAAVDGVVAGDGFVLLEPEKWIGKQFPLADHIDIGQRLLSGSWIVIFIHYDCPKCREAIRKHELGTGGHQRSRLALIEVPPFGDAESFSFGGHGRLNEGKQWYITTPSVITLRDGQVVAVESGDGLSLLE